MRTTTSSIVSSRKSKEKVTREGFDNHDLFMEGKVVRNY